MLGVQMIERDLIAGRSRAGVAAARGRVPGRPPVPTGEKLDAAGKMRESGRHSMGAVARSLGVGRATLYRWINRDHPECPA